MGPLLEQQASRLDNLVRSESANPPLQNKVNSGIARVYKDNGMDSVPSFVTDYIFEERSMPIRKICPCYFDFACLVFVLTI